MDEVDVVGPKYDAASGVGADAGGAGASAKRCSNSSAPSSGFDPEIRVILYRVSLGYAAA